MVDTRKFGVTPQAIAMGREIGIGGDVPKRLLRMARRSAPFKHVEGNRRFDDFVLLVQDRVILAVNRLQ